MSARRAAAPVLALAAAVAVVVATVLARDAPEPDARAATAPPPLVAQGSLGPRASLFGDTITARIAVSVDRARVDPRAVRVDASFSPYRLVGRPLRAQRHAGRVSVLETTYLLRCLTSACAPRDRPFRAQFAPAVVMGGGERREVAWPALTVYSRLDASTFDGNAGWRADLISLPPVSYRVAPAFARALLLGGGGALLLAAGALAWWARPRRVVEARPAQARPEPLSPLEQALALLEDAGRADGAEERRRALERVADALEDGGDHELACVARQLAWAAEEAAPESARALAARVRSGSPAEEAHDAPA